MNRFPLLLAAAVLAGTLATGCAGSKVSEADVQAAREFDDFPLYWLGDRYKEWDLAVIQGLDGTSEFVTFIYGECTPHDGEQPSCTPPLEIQVSPLCSHLGDVARAPIWKRRRIRGAPVGTIDSAPVLFTRGSQVKVYRGEGSSPGDTMRALRALRSINRVPPIVGPAGPIPGPSAEVLEGTRPCSA